MGYNEARHVRLRHSQYHRTWHRSSSTAPIPTSRNGCGSRPKYALPLQPHPSGFWAKPKLAPAPHLTDLIAAQIKIGGIRDIGYQIAAHSVAVVKKSMLMELPGFATSPTPERWCSNALFSDTRRGNLPPGHARNEKMKVAEMRGGPY